MYKQDFALNNPQVLICHKIHPANHGKDMNFLILPAMG